MKKSFALLFILAACGAEKLPAPAVLSVSPSEGSASAVTPVAVRVQAVLPTFVDYGKSTATVQSDVTIFVGGLNVGSTSLSAAGEVRGVVPSAFLPGAYDVRAVLADGREATLPGGFTITAGNWPASYAIDPIGDQQQGQPFTITVRAVGGGAASFSGTVSLSASKGTISPTTSSPFTNGVLTQQISVTGKGTGYQVTVTDATGTTATSNAFRVQ